MEKDEIQRQVLRATENLITEYRNRVNEVLEYKMREMGSMARIKGETELADILDHADLRNADFDDPKQVQLLRNKMESRGYILELIIKQPEFHYEGNEIGIKFNSDHVQIKVIKDCFTY